MADQKRRPPRRRCKGKTRAGKRCRAAPLKGDEFCSAHNPMRPDETRFGSSAQARLAGASDKPRKPKLSEVLKCRVEEEAETILAPYFAALERAVLYAKYRGDVVLSDVPDLEARQRAAERLLNRVYGRPRVADAPLADEGPLGRLSEQADLRRLTDSDLRALQRLLEKAHGYE